jgi:hypothetical protein
MYTPEGHIDLRQRLAERLGPLALAIGLLISMGFPATYFAMGSSALQETGSYYAEELAAKFRHIILENPCLWKYQYHHYGYILEDIVDHQKYLSRIRILDEHERVIPGYGYATDRDAGWWDWHAPTASAHIMFSNRQVGTVQVEVSRRTLMRTSGQFLLISTVVGGCLALLAYLFPVRVVAGMEGHIQTLSWEMRAVYDRVWSICWVTPSNSPTTAR